MEGCGVAAGDTWLSQTLPTLFNSPAWTQQKSLLILTTDEDGANSPGGWGPGQTNQVMTLAIGSQGTVKAGYQDSNRYDHYSSARVIEGALGLTSTMTNNDKWATPFNEVFTGGASTGNTVTVTNPGSQSGTVGTAANLQLTASDSASGQTLTYSATGLPAGLSVNSSTGQISGTPTTAGSSTVSVTATDTTGATGSTTFTWTESASGGGSALANGGFETGDLTGWTPVGSTSVSAAAAHSGGYGAMLGSTGPSTTSSVSQTFTAPAGSSSLSFKYDVTCQDTVTYDWATASLKDNTSGTTATVLPKTCTNGAGWQTASGTLTPGHSYTLTLTNLDDNYPGDPTFTYYDDVTVS